MHNPVIQEVLWKWLAFRQEQNRFMGGTGFLSKRDRITAAMKESVSWCLVPADWRDEDLYHACL